MGFPIVFRSVLAHYWDFNGRMSRLAYWQWMAFTVLALTIISGVGSAHVAAYGSAGSGPGLFWGAAVIAILIPTVAATCRRMQDAGFSSWLLLSLLIPILGFGFVLGILIRPGDPRGNKYGPGPAFP